MGKITHGSNAMCPVPYGRHWQLPALTSSKYSVSQYSSLKPHQSKDERGHHLTRHFVCHCPSLPFPDKPIIVDQVYIRISVILLFVCYSLGSLCQLGYG